MYIIEFKSETSAYYVLTTSNPFTVTIDRDEALRCFTEEDALMKLKAIRRKHKTDKGSVVIW